MANRSYGAHRFARRLRREPVSRRTGNLSRCRVVADYEDYTYAVVTALIGAIVWGIVGFLFEWIPLLGPVLVLIAYVAVIQFRYPGGWGDAVLIALIAWIASLAVLYVLAVIGISTFEAVGVPGA